MRHIDFTPLYRSTVGFDRLFNLLDSVSGVRRRARPPTRPTTSSGSARTSTGSPWRWRASARTRSTSTSRSRRSTSSGEKKAEEKEREFLHRGIAARTFERRFQLADHVEVKGADLKDGLLHVDLVRNVPERLKPRTIAIGTAGSASRSRSLPNGSSRGSGTTAGAAQRRPSSFFQASPDRAQPLVLGEHGDAGLARLGELGAGIGAGHHVVGLLGDRARHLGAQPLGQRLGLGARHLLERAGEHHRLVGDGRGCRRCAHERLRRRPAPAGRRAPRCCAARRRKSTSASTTVSPMPSMLSRSR